MDRDLLVTSRIEDGRKLLDFIDSEGYTVRVAAWVKLFEAQIWSLCVGVETVQPGAWSRADQAALQALSQLNLTGIAPSLLDVAPMSDSLPQDLIALRDQDSTRIGTKLKRRSRVGRLEIRGVYFYPASYGLAGPDAVVHSVLQMLDRSGRVMPSVVTFRDGSRIHAVPVGIRLNTPDGARIDWHDVVTSQDRSVAATEVVSIL